MKTTNKVYLLIVFAALALASCSDNYLEKKPLDSYSEVDVFADAALLGDFVSGTYRGIRHPFDDSENSLTDGLTDNAFNQHGSAEPIIKVYTRGEVNADNGEGVTRSLWQTAYQNISRTNLFFEKIEGSAIEPADLEPLEGQMHFLRAFFYFDLLRWYGSVPLVTHTFELSDESFDVTNNTPQEVGAYIVAECDLAIAKSYSSGDDAYQTGRATKETAMALKARTLLYLASPLFNPSNDQSKWTAARDANLAVMNLPQYKLVGDAPAYGAMFRGENTDEVILARYFTAVNDQGWGANTWLFPNSEGGWSNTTPTQDLVDGYEITTGLLPADEPSYDDQDPYVNRDPRFYESILFNGAPFKSATYDPYVDKAEPSNAAKAGKDSPSSSIAKHNASRTGYTFRKWALESENWDSGNKGPWIVFRLGEFYLNYAEAEIALGHETEAKTAINAIRARVNMPPVTESAATLVERYRRERRVELLLEDHRFFDIRRWQIGPETMGKTAKGVTIYKNGATMEYDYSRVADDTRTWNDKMYLLPIPAQEILRSHETLRQNPGY
jgi:hypothetical protein